MAGGRYCIRKGRERQEGLQRGGDIKLVPNKRMRSWPVARDRSGLSPKIENRSLQNVLEKIGDDGAGWPCMLLRDRLSGYMGYHSSRL